MQNHLIHRQVQDPEAEEHHTVSKSLHQRGSKAQCRTDKTQQLHGSVSVQAKPRSQPQQRGRGEQLLHQRLPAVSQLPAGREQPLISIQTCTQTRKATVLIMLVVSSGFIMLLFFNEFYFSVLEIIIWVIIIWWPAGWNRKITTLVIHMWCSSISKMNENILL